MTDTELLDWLERERPIPTVTTQVAQRDGYYQTWTITCPWRRDGEFTGRTFREALTKAASRP